MRFAAARPGLYAAMMSRVLQGGKIPAAEQGFAQLIDRIAAIAAEGRLAVMSEAAVDLAWASANAAALLHVTAQFRKTTPPDPTTVIGLREQAMTLILTPKLKGKSR